MKGKLINQYKKNNQLDIEEIILDYSAYLFKTVKNTSIIFPNEDIEEIILDTFFIVWKNQEKLRENYFIEPYLVGVTKNLIKNKYRSKNFPIQVETLEENITDNETIDDLAEQKEKNRIIEKALDKMSTKDKNIFVLFYYHNRTIKEIALALQMTEGNVKVKLYRIRKHIQKCLMKRGYGYEGK